MIINEIANIYQYLSTVKGLNREAIANADVIVYREEANESDIKVLKCRGVETDFDFNHGANFKHLNGTIELVYYVNKPSANTDTKYINNMAEVRYNQLKLDPQTRICLQIIA